MGLRNISQDVWLILYCLIATCSWLVAALPMLKAAQLRARRIGKATIRILKSIGIWKMTHKLALVQIFSVFFDGCLRCGCLMRELILELVDVAIVLPTAFGGWRRSDTVPVWRLAELWAQSSLICPISAASSQREIASGNGQRRRVGTLMASCLIKPLATSCSFSRNWLRTSKHP